MNVPLTIYELSGYRTLRDCGAIMIRRGNMTVARFGGLRARGLAEVFASIGSDKVCIRITERGRQEYGSLVGEARQ